MDQNIKERFMKIAVASVSDACEQICGCRRWMDYEMLPRINDRKLVGPAVTVQEGPANGVNAGPSHAFDVMDDIAEEGDIMVISMANSDKNVALWGGIMSAGAVANKMAGAILDGGLRDIGEIRTNFNDCFQVYSRSISPNTTLGKYITLDKMVPVMCGGIMVCPGDLIVADESGVVAVPKDSIEAVLEKCEQIEATELLEAKMILEEHSAKKGIAKFNRL